MINKWLWNTGEPPKRGAYRVKSDGPSANAGYRYWFGDHWGMLCQKRKHATAQNEARRVTLKHAVLWASPAPPPTIGSDEFDALLMAYRIAEPSKASTVRESIVTHVDAVINRTPPKAENE